jgi:hypothetical protein
MKYLKTAKAGSLILGALFLASFSFGAAAAEAKAGFALLENLTKEVVTAAKNEISAAEVEDRLNGLIAEAKKAHSSELIDPYFFKRYSALLAFIKLGLTADDPEGILWPLIERGAGDYIRSVTGSEPPGSLKANYAQHGAVGLASISSAVISEVTTLHLYLETKDRRPEVMKYYLQIGK